MSKPIQFEIKDLAIAVPIVPSKEHEFLADNKTTAAAFGVTEQDIRKLKMEHPVELLENKHFICVTKSNAVQMGFNIAKNTPDSRVLNLWTQRGICRLGMFIKSDRAMIVRDWAEQLMIERLEEDADPELGITRAHQRAVERYKKQGKDEAWISNRIEGIGSRYGFTSALSRHGVTGRLYADCTNIVYENLLGLHAKALKRKNKTSNTRDGLKRSEIQAIGLTETLTADALTSDLQNGRGGPGHAKHRVEEISYELSKAINRIKASSGRGVRYEI